MCALVGHIEVLHCTMEVTEGYPGVCCEKAGLTVNDIKKAPPFGLKITNGIAYELYDNNICVNGKKSSVESIMYLCGFSTEKQNCQKVVNKVRMMLKRIKQKNALMQKRVEEKKDDESKSIATEYLQKDFKHFKDNYEEYIKQHKSRLTQPPPAPLTTRVQLPKSSSSSSPDTSTADSTGSSDDQKMADENAGQCSLWDKGKRCRNSAGKAKYHLNTERLQSLGLQKDDAVPHSYICTFHGAMIRNSQRRKRKRIDPSDKPPEVDFFQLDVKTLNRYKKYFKITHRSGVSKQQLSEAVTKHFHNLPVNEEEIITQFCHHAKRSRNET